MSAENPGFPAPQAHRRGRGGESCSPSVLLSDMADTNGDSNKRENEEDGEQPAKAPRRNRWDTPGAAAEAAPAASSLANLSSIQAGAAAAKELARDALAKAQRAAEIQQVVNAKMGSLVGLPGGQTPARPAVQTVRLDAQGRLLDEQGKVIQSTARQQSSLMVNSNQRASASVDLLMETPPDISTNKYYDPRMKLPGEGREKRKGRAFNFVAEGSWSRKGDDLREQANIDHLLAEAKGKSKSSSKSLVSKDDHSLPMLWGGQGEGGASSSGDGKTAVAVSATTLKQKLAAVPAVEWWDIPLLRGASYTAAPGNTLEANMMLEIVTHYVEHPIPVEPPAEPAPPAPQPLPLTKRERKKLRTQRRLAAEKERQDQIRCGLMPPPPPKVKISNLMQAMKDDAVADPSAMEAKVRAEMAQRIQNHEMRNQARKVDPEQRKDKKRRKMTNDPSGGGVPVTLYRVDEIPSKQKLYKIDINAQQNHLTGVALLVEDFCVVIVEGGPKAQKRYGKLLMQRIDWGDVAEEEEEEEEEEVAPQEEDCEERRRDVAERCKVVWEGQVIKANFKAFRVEPARTAGVARKLLKDRGCEHYWDMSGCTPGTSYPSPTDRTSRRRVCAAALTSPHHPPARAA